MAAEHVLSTTEVKNIHSLQDYVKVTLYAVDKDLPETWSFRRDSLGLLITIENFSTDVETTVIYNYKNGEQTRCSITAQVPALKDELSTACDKLIDAVTEILGAGEDLKIVIREAKEKFLDEQKKFTNKLEEFREALTQNLHNARLNQIPAVGIGPDGTIHFFNEQDN